MKTVRNLLIVAAFVAATANIGWADEMLRLKLSMDEYGNATVSVESTEEPLANATEFTGDVVESSRLPNSTIVKDQSGMVRLLHKFDDPDEFDELFGGWPSVPNMNARFDKRFQCLLMTSAEGEDAVVTYSYRTTPPFTVACDRYRMSRNSTLRLLMINDDLGMLGVVVSTGKRGVEIPNGSANLTVNWVDIENGQQGRRRQLVQPVEFVIADGIEEKFRLPLPNLKLEDAFRLHMRANSSPQQVHHEIAGLLVQGRVSPVFGIVLDERRGVVYVKGWGKGSITEKSGIQVGDVIRTINGTTPDDLSSAVKLIGDTVLGDTLILELERAGKRSTISVMSE
jgi:serine protease Do